jgi:putative membrane protein
MRLIRPLMILTATALSTAGLAAAASPPVTSVDRAFVAGASASNATEIAMARVVLERTKNPAVRTFARRMIRDHTKLGAALASTAARLQLKTQTSPSTTEGKAIGKLGTLSDDARDRAYARAQVKAHTSTLALFQKEVSHGGATLLKKAGEKAIPTIRMHLTMAKELAAAVMKP